MLYILTFYTKASYINKNVYYTCTVFAIKDPPLLGRCCYLKLKYHIIYNWTLKICSWLALATIYNKHFQSILCYQSISHICHKFRNFLLSEKKKKMSTCSGTMSWTKFYIISQSLQVIIQEKSHWPPWPLWQRPWIILEQDLRPYQHYNKLLLVVVVLVYNFPKFLNYKLLKNFLWTCQPMFFKSF